MPKLVNYACRFELVREAAFAVVCDRGPAALSRYTIAAVLGTSINTVRRLVDPGADLRTLAADAVRRRQRHGRFGRLRDVEPLERACHAVGGMLPSEWGRVAEELVWLRLRLDAARLPSQAAAVETPVSTTFYLTEHGFPPEEQAAPEAETTAAAGPIAHHVQEYEEDVALRVADALVTLEEADRPAEAVRLRAVIDGVVLATCLGRLTPGEGQAVVERHLRLVLGASAAPQSSDQRRAGLG